jgi:membrane protein insertase Oxa1/YidC/SpoIIIJ
LTWQIERSRPFNRRKRAIMGTVIIFLIIVTSVTSMLTVSADHEFERLSSNPWVTQDQVTKSNIVFSVCVAFSFFCATITIGLIIIWFGLEICFIVHRREILRRATANLLRNQSV